MARFDRRIKREAKNFKVPESYGKRVEETLRSASGEDVSYPHKARGKSHKGLLVFACVCIVCVLLFSTAEVTQAGFLERFKETILDFFGIGAEESEELGIESAKDNAVGRPDLMLELVEKVIDGSNIYLVVNITAPADVAFSEEIGFEYFVFVEGENYNVDRLIPGTTDCKLLEVSEERENIASYVVSLSTTEELVEGTEVTAFFKDLTRDPYGEKPELLVEGMWSVTFEVEQTVSEEIHRAGSPLMTYPFLGTEAKLTELTLTPLGMTLVSDISEVDYEQLGFADTRVEIRLKLLDGSELLVESRDEEAELVIGSSSISYEETEGGILMTYTCQFREPVLAAGVSGVYLEDCYFSLREQ